MAVYHKCPNCGNTEKGSEIYRCTECGRVGCFKMGFLTADGCWTWGNKNKGAIMRSRCPDCDKEHFIASHKQIGEIE